MKIPNNARVGTVESCALRLKKSDGALVHEFTLTGSSEMLTISRFPEERTVQVGDSVIVHLHPQYPTHVQQLIVDVPARLTQSGQSQ